MNIFRRHPLLLICSIGFAIFSGTLAAQGFDQLKDITGSGLGGAASSLGSLSSITSGSTGNATGIIEYCMKNNYLSGDSASSVKDQLMGKITGSGDQSPQSESDYIKGSQGIVSGSDGQSVDLSMTGMKGAAVKKACETILEQGKAMLEK
jgi:hypothetical protein